MLWMFYEGKYFSKTIDNARKFIHFTHYLPTYEQRVHWEQLMSNAYDTCDQFIVLYNRRWTSCNIELLLISSLLEETRRGNVPKNRNMHLCKDDRQKFYWISSVSNILVPNIRKMILVRKICRSNHGKIDFIWLILHIYSNFWNITITFLILQLLKYFNSMYCIHN